MAKRKAAKQRGVAGGRRAPPSGGKRPTGRKTPRARQPQHPRAKTVQPRVFRRAARLAQDALTALDADKLDEVREYLQSIRAVALCADER